MTWMTTSYLSRRGKGNASARERRRAPIGLRPSRGRPCELLEAAAIGDEGVHAKLIELDDQARRRTKLRDQLMAEQAEREKAAQEPREAAAEVERARLQAIVAAEETRAKERERLQRIGEGHASAEQAEIEALEAKRLAFKRKATGLPPGD